MRIGPVVDVALQLLEWIIFAEVLLSWFPRPVRRGVYYTIRRAVSDLADPILLPLRRLLPDTGRIDFSPLVAIFLIEIVRKAIFRIL